MSRALQPPFRSIVSRLAIGTLASPKWQARLGWLYAVFGAFDVVVAIDGWTAHRGAWFVFFSLGYFAVSIGFFVQARRLARTAPTSPKPTA